MPAVLGKPVVLACWAEASGIEGFCEGPGWRLDLCREGKLNEGALLILVSVIEAFEACGMPAWIGWDTDGPDGPCKAELGAVPFTSPKFIGLSRRPTGEGLGV